MVRLPDLTATAHRDGNRVDLAWSYPVVLDKPLGARVVRAERSHPAGPDDGTVVAEGAGLTSACDRGLKGETVYYYSVFPFTGAPPRYDLDPHNRTSAMALSPYGFADLLYGLLPEIARRYDAGTLPRPGTVPAALAGYGQLRRFLELPGGEFDRLYSLARATLGSADIERVDGRFLPFLAQWIGWESDHNQSLDAQRSTLHAAPRILQTVGTVAALDAMVTRITGWTNRTKEFVHNVARTNQPERLNLWSAVRDASGVFQPPALTSVNFAYDGRPAAVPEEDGSSALVFYHTWRDGRNAIRAKRYEDGVWGPGLPVADQPGIGKHPAAARYSDRLRLFWQAYDPAAAAADRKWRIWWTTRTRTGWTTPEVFGDLTTERWMPAAVADDVGGIWLFWREKAAQAGQPDRLRYNRHDGTHWQLTEPATMPPDGAEDPRVEEDLFALLRPVSGAGRLWLFWARQEAVPAADGDPLAGQTRWHVVYRVKQGLDPSASDWSPVESLPRESDVHHDRQPAALLSDGGAVELFWSSTRSGAWSVFRSTLPAGSDTWGTAEEAVGPSPYTRKGPVAVTVGDRTLLVYRSNESPRNASTLSGATRTVDHRYAGTTTVDTRAHAKQALYHTFEDFQTYLYDTGSGGTGGRAGRVARDSVGLFVTPSGPGSSDPAAVTASLARLAGAVRDFVPMTVRPFITE